MFSPAKKPTKVAEQKVDVAQTFKQRLADYRKQYTHGLSFADQMELRDPQAIIEYTKSIYENMREKESKYTLAPDFLAKTQVPAEVKDTSRAFLVEWIIDVHRKFKLMPETLYVTIHLVDQFLAVQQIKKNQLHILGVTAILIATKYEEIYPPELKELLVVSENKFSKAEVLKMEKEMLVALQFEVVAPTPYRFLERFRKLMPSANDDKVFFFAQYILEVSLLDSSLLKYRASELAAASLVLSTRALKKSSAWGKDMERHTGINDSGLQKVVEDVRSFVVEINPKFLTTLKYKFGKKEYLEVASVPFKFDPKDSKAN